MRFSLLTIGLLIATILTPTSHAIESIDNLHCYQMISTTITALGDNETVGFGCSDTREKADELANKRARELDSYEKQSSTGNPHVEGITGTRTLGYAGKDTHGKNGTRLYVRFKDKDPGDCDEKGYRIILQKEIRDSVRSFVGATESPNCNWAQAWAYRGIHSTQQSLPINELQQNLSGNVERVQYFHR